MAGGVLDGQVMSKQWSPWSSHMQSPETSPCCQEKVYGQLSSDQEGKIYGICAGCRQRVAEFDVKVERMRVLVIPEVHSTNGRVSQC